MEFGNKLAEMLRQGSDTILNLPTEAQRFLTNPQAFTQLVTGKNPLPKETGFVAGATGLPAKNPVQGGVLNPASAPYQEGYEQGEPVSIAAMAVPAYAMALRAGAPKTYNALENYMVKSGGIMPLTAYHGTPHTIQGKFDINKVGTGEGAQAYGHGMYFAEAPSVAETYKRAGGGLEVKFAKPLEELGINPKVATHSMGLDESPLNQGLGGITKSLRSTALDYPDVPVNQSLVKEHFDEYIRLLDDKYATEAAQKKALQDLVAKEGYPDISFGGNLYKVDIPDAFIPTMMDYDKPLGQQNAVVKKALNELKKQITPEMKMELGGDINLLFGKDVTPVQFLNTMEIIHPTGGVGIGEKMLNDLGVKGVRYLDGTSRVEGKGTSNFVVFDPSDVKILEKNNQPVTRKELIQEQVDKLD